MCERGKQSESYKLALAHLDAGTSLDKVQMSALQVCSIQSGRTASIRWPASGDGYAAGTVHVLLAPLLLGHVAWSPCGLNSRQHSLWTTSETKKARTIC